MRDQKISTKSSSSLSKIFRTSDQQSPKTGAPNMTDPPYSPVRWLVSRVSLSSGKAKRWQRCHTSYLYHSSTPSPIFVLFFTSIVLENLLHPDSCLPGTHYGVTHGSKSQERATGTPRLNSQVYGSSFFFKNKKTNHS